MGGFVVLVSILQQGAVPSRDGADGYNAVDAP